MWLAYPRGSLKASLPCPHADLCFSKAVVLLHPTQWVGMGPKPNPIVRACFQAHLFPGWGRLGWCGSMRATPSGGAPSLLLGRVVLPSGPDLGHEGPPRGTAQQTAGRSGAAGLIRPFHACQACCHAGLAGQFTVRPSSALRPRASHSPSAPTRTTRRAPAALGGRAGSGGTSAGATGAAGGTSAASSILLQGGCRRRHRAPGDAQLQLPAMTTMRRCRRRQRC